MPLLWKDLRQSIKRLNTLPTPALATESVLLGAHLQVGEDHPIHANGGHSGDEEWNLTLEPSGRQVVLLFVRWCRRGQREE